MQLDLSNIDAYAAGCAFLGCGGGGDVIGATLARYALDTFGPVQVITPEDLDLDDLVMPCADMGAPLIFFEKMAAGDEGEVLRREMEAIMGKPVKAILAAEIGGSNGLTPVAWAARMGLPVIDGDGIGRAFPEINMITLELNGVPISPAVIVDERHNVVVIRSIDSPWMERIARQVVVEFGAQAALACYPMDAATVAKSAVLGSVSRALSLGDALANAEGDRVTAVCEFAGAIEIARGKIIELDRRVEGGFVIGTILIEGTGADAGRELRVEFQNEFLIATEGGSPRAMVPDLISILDVHTGDAISTERMRYGMRIALVGLAAPDIWRTERGLDVGGPGAFGYDLDYRTVESLNGR